MEEMSKLDWLAEDDSNMKCFHARASNRMKRNQILQLKDEGGVWRDRLEEVESIISAYFQRLFLSSEPSNQDLESVLGAIQPQVMLEMNQLLLYPDSAQEVSFFI